MSIAYPNAKWITNYAPEHYLMPLDWGVKAGWEIDPKITNWYEWQMSWGWADWGFLTPEGDWLTKEVKNYQALRYRPGIEFAIADPTTKSPDGGIINGSWIKIGNQYVIKGGPGIYGFQTFLHKVNSFDFGHLILTAKPEIALFSIRMGFHALAIPFEFIRIPWEEKLIPLIGKKLKKPFEAILIAEKNNILDYRYLDLAKRWKRLINLRTIMLEEDGFHQWFKSTAFKKGDEPTCEDFLNFIRK